MKNFVLVYKGGGIPTTEEEQNAVMAAWGAWFGSLGDAVVDMGTPFAGSKSVGSNGSPSDLTGYSIVSAGSLDDAVGLAGSCPIIDGGGGVEVYETLQM